MTKSDSAPKRSNCLVWALQRARRAKRETGDSGYYIIRETRMKFRWRWPLSFLSRLTWPHFFWSPVVPEEAESYVPIEKKRKMLPPLWFPGRVQHGDPPDDDA